MIKKFIVFGILIVKVLVAQAAIIDLETKSTLQLTELVNQVSAGDIIIMGESHAQPGQPNLDQKNQVELITALLKKNRNVSVGMEFLKFTTQPRINEYLLNKISDSQFLIDAQWDQQPFVDYKTQILLPTLGMGWTYGLNSPAEVTKFVRKNGLAQITPEYTLLLPPNFELGDSKYETRFNEYMGFIAHHGGVLEYYFQAQSIWDDTMAWQALEIMKSNPNQILVIIVGNFHVQYDGGLPNRIKNRGYSKVKTIIQSSGFKDLAPNEINLFFDHPTYGRLSNYFW